MKEVTRISWEIWVKLLKELMPENKLLKFIKKWKQMPIKEEKNWSNLLLFIGQLVKSLIKTPLRSNWKISTNFPSHTTLFLKFSEPMKWINERP